MDTEFAILVAFLCSYCLSLYMQYRHYKAQYNELHSWYVYECQRRIDTRIELAKALDEIDRLKEGK